MHPSTAPIQVFIQPVAVRSDSVLSIFTQILKIMGIRIESLVGINYYDCV